jgi:GntR family transcriptional regulator
MEIDLTSSVPIFRQIVDGICAAVAAGVYKPGELIPSVRQQAIALLVNPNTVQRAYEQLERDGLLVTRRGSGLEVAPGAPAAAAAKMAQAVQNTFNQAIDQARSAHLTRTTIDGLYRKAWNGDRPGGEQ